MKTTTSGLLLGAAISLLATVQAMQPNPKLRLQPHYIVPAEERIETPPPSYPCTPPPRPPASGDCCSKVWNPAQFAVPCDLRCPPEFVQGLLCGINVQRSIRNLKPLVLSGALNNLAARWAAQPGGREKPYLNYRELRYGQAPWVLWRQAPCYGPMEASPSNVLSYYYPKCTDFRPLIVHNRGQVFRYSEQSWNSTSQMGVSCVSFPEDNGDQKLVVHVYFDHPKADSKYVWADNEEIAKEIDQDKSLAEDEKPEVNVPQAPGDKQEEKNEEGKDEKPEPEGKAEEETEEKEEEEEKEEKEE